MGVTVQQLKVRLILEKEGSILLLKQTNKQGGKYTLVGGKVEVDETPIEALIRESREEAGITLLPVDLELVHTLYKEKGQERRISLYFRATHYEGKARSKEPEKFKKVGWFPWNALPEKLSPTTAHMLRHYRSGSQYSQFL